MYVNLSESLFIELMGDKDYHGFSYRGLKALYQIIEEFEKSIGESIEFDRVVIRTVFSEYDSLEDLMADYDLAAGDLDSAYYVEFDGGIILDNGTII